MTKTAEARKMLGQLTEELDRMDVLYAINERQRDTIRMQRETIARLNRSAEQMQREAFERGRSDRVNPFRFVPEGVSAEPVNPIPRMLRTEFVPKQHPPGSPEIVRDACDAIVKAGDSLHATKTRKTVVCNVTDRGSPFPPGTIFENGPEWHGIPIDEPATMDGSWSPAELDENKPKVVSEADRLREQLDIFRDELRRIEQHLKAVGIELKFRDDGSFVGVRAPNLWNQR